MATARKLSKTVADNVRAVARDRGITIAMIINETGIPERTFKRRMTGLSAWTTDEINLVGKVLHLDEDATADLMRPKRASGVAT